MSLGLLYHFRTAFVVWDVISKWIPLAPEFSIKCRIQAGIVNSCSGTGFLNLNQSRAFLFVSRTQLLHYHIKEVCDL